MKSDIEIAQSTEMLPIEEIAKKVDIDRGYLSPYGDYKAKVCYRILSELQDKPSGKLILVTAISPTPAGEGKTTTSTGLADALNAVGKKTMLCLREPSLGPVFGIKGGATGGGYAQVIPMEDINLHFTGDLHAVSSANNLLAALVDNHIKQGNALNIDPRRIAWHRCLDMNDRQLRNIVDGMGGVGDGMPREDSFDITAASEIMAILCMADSITNLKERLARIVVGYKFGGAPVTAADLKAEGALALLLRDALNPNLVQTLEHTPAFVHGGPFANIAHGCNTILATRIALKLADYVVTEAGFGADLGAEKFCDIKCRYAGLKPSAAVIVATVRALKMHGGLAKDDLGHEDIDALKAGMPNLMRHVDNITKRFGLPAVVALNYFPTDTTAEIETVKEACAQKGVEVRISKVWGEGSKGGIDLANEVVRLADSGTAKFAPLYPLENSIKDKIAAIVTKIYGGRGAVYTPQAQKDIDALEKNGFSKLPICIAKTQYSFTDNPNILGAPSDFEITVRSARVSAGAGFIVVLTGAIMTMPGLPKHPAAEEMDIDADGTITGLF